MVWFVSLAFGQVALANPRLLKFEAATADLGRIRFDAGCVRVNFEFTNISDKDVNIVDVHTQCGCALPQWQEKSIAPGAKASVSVEYDPSHFIGPQKVGLTVVSTNGEYRKFNTLVILADVLRDITLEQARHPHVVAGTLLSDYATLGMRLQKRGEQPVREFELLNDDADHSYSVSFLPMSRAVSVIGHDKYSEPLTIAPGQKITIKVKVNTACLPDGPYEDYLLLLVDDGFSFPVLLKGAVE